MVNGAQGDVQEIITSEGKVRYVLVKFKSPKVGAKQRRRLRFLERITEVGDAVPIERVNFSYPLGDPRKAHGASATLSQVPLKLAWSMTSHKVVFTKWAFMVFLNINKISDSGVNHTKTKRDYSGYK